MTKKEYFNSEYVSPQTRNKIKAMWIMVGILAVIVLAYVVHTAVGLDDGTDARGNGGGI